MGKIKYQTRQVYCKECGTTTEGYSVNGSKAARDKVYCKQCAYDLSSGQLTVKQEEELDMGMTMNECLNKTGEATGVIQEDGTVNFYPSYIQALSDAYAMVKTPEQKAEVKQKKVEALVKARQVRADKKAELKRKQEEPCPGGCGYTIALCACDVMKKKIDNPPQVG